MNHRDGVMIRVLKSATLGVAIMMFALVLGFSGTANAATVIANQNLKSDGNSVDAADWSSGMRPIRIHPICFPSVWLVSIAIDVDPNVLVSPVLTIERTNGAPNIGNYPEAVDVYLGGTVTGSGLSELMLIATRVHL